jgi:hypothetical protein
MEEKNMEITKSVEYVMQRTISLEGAFCSRCNKMIEIADDGKLGNNSASSDLADEEDPDRRQF